MMTTLNRNDHRNIRYQAQGSRQGQIAIGSLAIMAMTLILVAMTVNLGQMAQVRVETSNAADAGALAGASWIASGQNEARDIAGKITDSILMVQAIFVVPFCPPEEPLNNKQARYANALWQSLHSHPDYMHPEWDYQGYHKRGPATYFKDVADDAMFAAWYIGAREMLTSIINNTVVRFPTGNESSCSSTDGGAVECVPVSNFGDYAETLKTLQVQFQTTSRPLPNQVFHGYNWNNMMQLDDPKHLTHKPRWKFNYPDDPPELELTSLRGQYWQYNRAIPAPAPDLPFFGCEFVGWGIRTERSGAWDKADLLVKVGDPELTYQDGHNPLRMVRDYDDDVDGEGHWFYRKGWDVDIGEQTTTGYYPVFIPSIDDLDVGKCSEHVCGMQEKGTNYSPNIRPTSFSGGTGSVEVTVSHEVSTVSGTHQVFGSYSPIPDFDQRFPPVASSSEAKFDAAGLGFGSGPAKATIIKAK